MSLQKATKPLHSPSKFNSNAYIDKPRPLYNKVIKPSIFLNVREKTKYMFHPLCSGEKRKLIAKFFGKKVILITKHSHTLQMCNRSKNFKRLELEEKYKSKIADSPVMLSIIKDHFSSHRDRVMLFADVSLERKHYRRLIPTKIRWISIKEQSSSTLSPIRRMTDGQILSLNIAENQLEDFLRSILRLSLLRRLDLCVSKSNAPQTKFLTENRLAEYFGQILNKESLSIVNLDLSYQSLSPDLLVQFKNILNKPKFNKWHLKVKMAHGFSTGHKYSKIFESIDYLSLETAEEESRPPIGRYYSPPKYHSLPECDCNSIRLQEILAQSQRALSLTFEKDHYLNLKPILKHCERLESLNINVKSVPVYWSQEINHQKEKDDLLWARHLHNIILTSHDEHRDELNDEDHEQIEEQPSPSWKSTFIFGKLLGMIKEAECQLKYARVYSCCINGGCYGDVHCMINHIRDVKTLTNLEHVDLTFSLFYRRPGDLFDELKTLKKLDLTYCDRCEGCYDWDSQIPFQDMANLTDVRVFVGEQERPLEPTDVNDRYSGGGESFIKSLDKLKNLEVFDLNYYNGGISPSVFWGLLEGFCQLTRLRRINLNTRVLKNEDELNSQDLENIKEDDICFKVETIIQRNPLLQEFYVKQVRFGGVEQIKYKK